VLTIVNQINDVMKKVFLSLGLCMGIAFAFAQQRSAGVTNSPSFYFGGGPTFSKFTGNLGNDASILVGAQVGLGMAWKLGNNFSVVPEVNVGMQGTKWDNYADQSYRLWFLNVPVVARYQFGQSGLFAETGPQLGVLLDAQKKEDDSKQDISDAFKSTSVNWNFGLGYNLNNNLAINARVTPGITDIDKTSATTTRQFTSALRLTFGF
jgi:hypothetical protein